MVLSGLFIWCRLGVRSTFYIFCSSFYTPIDGGVDFVHLFNLSDLRVYFCGPLDVHLIIILNISLSLNGNSIYTDIEIKCRYSVQACQFITIKVRSRVSRICRCGYARRAWSIENMRLIDVYSPVFVSYFRCIHWHYFKCWNGATSTILGANWAI